MRVSSYTSLALGALLMGATPLLSAAPIEFQSVATATPLLELYTSEGCSSCPPAEAWLSRIKENPKLWKDFVPVAFHVDYWDYLGWADPLGAADYSERQRAYAAAWKSRSVYTPGFVLDGQEWRGHLSPDKPPDSSHRTPGTLILSSDDGKSWLLRFEPVSRSLYGPVVFYVALLGFELSTDVKAGENRGRTLQHDFVVLRVSTAE